MKSRGRLQSSRRRAVGRIESRSHDVIYLGSHIWHRRSPSGPRLNETVQNIGDDDVGPEMVMATGHADWHWAAAFNQRGANIKGDPRSVLRDSLGPLPREAIVERPRVAQTPSSDVHTTGFGRTLVDMFFHSIRSVRHNPSSSAHGVQARIRMCGTR